MRGGSGDVVRGGATATAAAVMARIWLCDGGGSFSIWCVEVVAQWVRTSWTKRSRGGDAAARRNAVPACFPLPTVGAPLVHEVLMHEHEDFRPHGQTRTELPAADGVDLRQFGDRLRVQLVPSVWMMPRRDRRPPAIYLHRGQWVRWQINYRTSGTRSCRAEGGRCAVWGSRRVRRLQRLADTQVTSRVASFQAPAR